jgi:hypothetical protein
MTLPTYEEMTTANISTKADAQKYIGKGIFYLCSEDIDKSGRGYYWVRFMWVDEIAQGEFYGDGRYVPYRNILRIKIKEEESAHQ